MGALSRNRNGIFCWTVSLVPPSTFYPYAAEDTRALRLNKGSDASSKERK